MRRLTCHKPEGDNSDYQGITDVGIVTCSEVCCGWLCVCERVNE